MEAKAKKKKKKRPKCVLCKKKRLSFADTINMCKCRQSFCATCRREHDCEFDYAAKQKEQQLEIIEKEGATGSYDKLPDRL